MNLSTETTKKVSYIMPVYNAASYLRQSLDSVLNQDYTNIELIAVDDGSSDESLAILEEYAEKDPRVTALAQKNSGAPTARNKGLDHSVGEYIQFIDSDDFMAENITAKMVAAAEETGADIVMAWYDTVDEKGNYGKRVQLSLPAGTYDVNEYREQFALMTSMLGNKLLSAQMLKENDIHFTNLRQAQDLNHYMRLLMHAKKITIIDGVAYHYQVRSGSISHSYSSVITKTIDSIEDAEALYHEKGMMAERMFTNLKFKHYSFQLQKTPQIVDKEERKAVYRRFKNEFEKLNYDLLLPEYQSQYRKNRLKLLMGPVYTSSMYRRYQDYKAQKNIVS